MTENTERFEEQVERMAEIFERYSDTYVEYFEDLKKLKKGTKEYNEAQDRLWKNLKRSLNDFEKQVRKGTASFDDHLKQLEKLDDAIENTTDAEIRKGLEANRAAIAEKARAQSLNENVKEATTKIAKTTISATGNFVKGLQSNASATELASGLFTSAIDVAGSATSAAGKVLTDLGAVGVMLPGPLKRLGGAALIAGGALQFFGEALSPLAKFAISILSAEVEKTIKAFNTITSTGIGFADGMTGMRNAARDAGLTVNQFSEVIKNNQLDLARTGLGMAEAAATVGRVSRTFTTFDKNGKIVSNELLNLGYSFQEQAGLVAETMADMRRGGLLARASDAEIRQQTKEYAENLRVISGITGEDAKKRMQDARTAMANTAVQQKILEMQKTNPDAYRKLQAQLATMPAEMQKMYLQKLTLGTVVDPVSAVLMARVPELESSLTSMQGVLEDGTKNAKDATDDAARQRGLITKGLERAMPDLAIMGRAQMAGVTGIVSDTAGVAGSIYDQLAGTTEETGKRIRDGVTAQMSATDELTTGVNAAAVAAQNLAVDLETILTPAVGNYAKATAELLSYIEKAVNESGIGGRRIVGGSGAENAAEIDYGKSKMMSQIREDNPAFAMAPYDFSPSGERIEQFAKTRDARYLANLTKQRENLQQRLDAAKKENKFMVPALEANLAKKDKEIQELQEKMKRLSPQSGLPVVSDGKIKLSRIKTQSGSEANVDTSVAARFQGFINDLEASGYKIKDIQGFNDRNIAGSGIKSQHAYGRAIDINPSANPMGNKLVTDMPSNITRLAEKWGIGWGGDWSGKKDPMHFSADPREGGREMSLEETNRLLAEQNKTLGKIADTMADGNRDRKKIIENTR